MQVLIVDDSPVMRQYLIRALRMTGMDFQTEEAGTGTEAIYKAAIRRPDLIITDLNMPEMNGDQLVAEIARDPRLAGIPVVVLTSDRSAGRPGELMASGAAAFLTKPVSPETLKNSLLRIMETIL